MTDPITPEALAQIAREALDYQNSSWMCREDFVYLVLRLEDALQDIIDAVEQ